ncbi:Sulfate Permease (SulP) Family, partial [Thraustotheca clavata]
MSYIPRFFFAATLIFIAIDLLLEWLVHVYHKVLFQEYLVLWLSFIAINCVNLELGMIIGIGVAIVDFLIGYAQVNQVQRVYKSSTAIRNYAARTVIADKRDSIVVLELHGYLFFGTSVHIVADVKKFVRVLKPVNAYGSLVNRPLQHLDGTPLSPSESKNRLPTRYLVLDFKRVTGMDATAARSCFMILQEMCTTHKIEVIYASVLPSIQQLLLNNDIVDDSVLYRNCDEALEWCESNIILASRANSFFRADASLPLLLNRFVGLPDNATMFDPLAPYFKKEAVKEDHYFYHISQPSTAFYILGSGSVDLYMNKDGSVDNGESDSITLLEKVHVGAMFGEVDFFVQQIRHLSAQASSDCTVYCLTREAYMRMKEEQHVLWNELRDVIMKSMALTIGNNNWLSL